MDVIVVSAFGYDTNIYLHTDEIRYDVEANFSENYDLPGGGGLYSSLGFNAMNYKTSIIAALGNDIFGMDIKDRLDRKGIETSYCFEDIKGTKRSVNIIYKDGTRKNFYDGKGSMDIKIDPNVYGEIFKRTKLAHFNIVNWSRDLLKLAKKSGCIISADIQDIVSLDDSYRFDYINNADYLFFSAVNCSNLEKPAKYFLDINSDLKIIVGNGKKGCAYFDDKTTRFFPAVDIEGEIIDTTGAGDSLAVGFLSANIFEELSISDSILWGEIAARYICSKKMNEERIINRKILIEYFEELKGSFGSYK